MFLQPRANNVCCAAFKRTHARPTETKANSELNQPLVILINILIYRWFNMYENVFFVIYLHIVNSFVFKLIFSGVLIRFLSLNELRLLSTILPFTFWMDLISSFSLSLSRFYCVLQKGNECKFKLLWQCIVWMYFFVIFLIFAFILLFAKRNVEKNVFIVKMDFFFLLFFSFLCTASFKKLNGKRSFFFVTQFWSDFLI